MNKYESYACGQVFSTYPNDKTFEEILLLCINDELREAHNEALECTDNDDQQLILCDLYVYKSWIDIPEILDDILHSVYINFGENNSE
jgi:hypothetical protein